MAKNRGGVFGFEYLEDAELEQNDVVGCTSVIRGGPVGLPTPVPLPGPIVIDIPRMPDPFPGDIWGP